MQRLVIVPRYLSRTYIAFMHDLVQFQYSLLILTFISVILISSIQYSIVLLHLFQYSVFQFIDFIIETFIQFTLVLRYLIVIHKRMCTIGYKI